MKKSLHGVVHGRTIVLADDPGLADGTEITVVVQSAKSASQKTGAGLLRTAGALADDPHWDDIMEEIQQSRKTSARVTVIQVEEAADEPSLAFLLKFAGAADGLPPDMAAQHDNGTPLQDKER